MQGPKLEFNQEINHAPGQIIYARDFGCSLMEEVVEHPNAPIFFIMTLDTLFKYLNIGESSSEPNFSM